MQRDPTPRSPTRHPPHTNLTGSEPASPSYAEPITSAKLTKPTWIGSFLPIPD